MNQKKISGCHASKCIEKASKNEKNGDMHKLN